MTIRAQQNICMWRDHDIVRIIMELNGGLISDVNWLSRQPINEALFGQKTMRWDGSDYDCDINMVGWWWLCFSIFCVGGGGTIIVKSMLLKSRVDS